jgi:hypothetical protein
MPSFWDDLAIPPLLPRQKSSLRTISEGIYLAATMQSSSSAGLRAVITDGSSSMTTRRSSPLSCPGEEMGGMPSLPEPDPVRYFLMNHPLYPELQRLGIRNSMSFVPFATGARSLEEVELVIVQHFPPRSDDILYKGIFHSKQDDRMPTEQTWRKVLKCTVKALGRHGLDEAIVTKFLMDKTMGANLIPFDNVCTLYSNKDTRPSYNAFAKEAHPLMTDIFKDIVQACPNIKAVVIHGEEPYKVIVKNGGVIPLELIVNKTHNVAHGCRLSRNAYCSCEWIIYTDVVVEVVAILLDQDAIPLVTTEDRNEILLEPTWNSTEEKAARKRKRKDGMTAVEKAADEAKCVAKAAERNRKRAEKVAVDKAQRVAKAAERDRKRVEKVAVDEAKHVAKAAERDRKRAEKEAEDEAQRVAKIAERDRKRAKKEADEAQRVTKAAQRAEVDALIESMIKGGVSFSKMESKLGHHSTQSYTRKVILLM